MKSESKLLTMAAFILFIFSFFAVALAEIKEVKIGIDGLSCPFCVWGLKKQMKKIEGIEKLDINLKKSVATITPKEKVLLDIKDYKDAVKKAGFSVREVKIVAEGEVETHLKRETEIVGGRKIETRREFLVLKVSGTEQLFVLDKAKGLQAGLRVSIKGKVHEHPEGEPYGLSVEKVEIIKEEG